MSELTVNELVALIERLSASKGEKAYAGSGKQMYDHGMWGYCGEDEVLSAYVDGSPFTDWLGWVGERHERNNVKILTHIAPEGREAGSVTSGVLADECDEPNSVEWGRCEIDLTKGLLGRCGNEVAAVNIDYGYCEEQPIYRIDGTLITDDAEWQAALAAKVLAQDLEMQLVSGNRATTNQFDGVQRLVKTGYTDCRTGAVCPNVDSIVVNWASDGLAGSNNGHGTIINKISDILRRLKLRAKGHPQIDFANDVVIMLPTFLRDCLVDYWAQYGGWLVTGQVQIDATVINENRARWIQGGKFGNGWVPVDGTPISFLCNDYLPVSAGFAGGNLGDIYILTRAIGGIPVLYGVYQDFTKAGQSLAARFGGDRFKVTDGGRFIVYQKITNETCFNTCILVRPGLKIKAPWLQARIYDVGCAVQFEPVSKRPDSDYFLYGPYATPYHGDLKCY